MAITLKEVAAKSGVTVTTVSRVLNNRGHISKKTKEKVNQAIAELNYHPNEAARSLIKKHSNMIGIIVPTVKNPFFAEVVEYLEEYAFKQNHKIMLCNSYHQKEKEIEYIEMLKSNKVAGIFISSRTSGIEQYLSANMPVVSFERVISSQISSVACDNYQGGTLATKCLIERGCKNIGHIGRVSGLNMLADERCHAFLEVCKAAGVDYHVFDTEESQFQSMDYSSWLDKILEQNPDMDGVFASSDIIAAQLIGACAKRGIRIPSDMKIVGFDDISIASWITPKITTVHQPLEQMCRSAVNTILQERSGENQPTRSLFGVTLIQRETT